MVAPLTAGEVSQQVYQSIQKAATTLHPEFECALRAAAEVETHPRGKAALDQLLQNAAIAKERSLPLCQDTGTVWVYLSVGTEEALDPGIFSGVNDAVARAYQEGYLRKSVLHDALIDRTNTTTNTPAFTEIDFHEGQGITLHVMLKGGGSDNASKVVMLPPGAGVQGVKDVVLETVNEKAASACPPLLIGVGVGATFDKVAGLAKKALLRPVGESAPNEATAALERELLHEVNATSIGPGGFGGVVTALAVHINTAPCHIAALPVAVNMGCSAMRFESVVMR